MPMDFFFSFRLLLFCYTYVCWLFYFAHFAVGSHAGGQPARQAGRHIKNKKLKNKKPNRWCGIKYGERTCDMHRRASVTIQLVQFIFDIIGIISGQCFSARGTVQCHGFHLISVCVCVCCCCLRFVSLASLHLSLAISAFDGIKIGFCNKIAFIEFSSEWGMMREASGSCAEPCMCLGYIKTENVSLFSSIETVFPPSFVISCVCVWGRVARACVYSCCVLYVHDRLFSIFRVSGMNA